jgi:xylitol oxidase
VLAALEERLAPFGARPHWGKLFTLRPDVVRSLYGRATHFGELRRRYDPTGKFGSDLVDEWFPR